MYIYLDLIIFNIKLLLYDTKLQFLIRYLQYIMFFIYTVCFCKQKLFCVFWSSCLYVCFRLCLLLLCPMPYSFVLASLPLWLVVVGGRCFD